VSSVDEVDVVEVGDVHTSHAESYLFGQLVPKVKGVLKNYSSII
jgi:hypothetical protein